MAKNNKEKSQKISTILEILKRLKDSYLFTEVLGWLFIFLSIFTVISDLDKGGVLGNYYKNLMIQIFGISHFGLILLFLFLGISWLLRFNINWKISTSFALLILFLTFSIFSEIVFQDGGIIGKWLLSFENYLGRIGLVVVLIILLFISLSIIFQKPFSEILNLILQRFKKEKIEIEDYTKEAKKEIKEKKEQVKAPEIIRPTKIKQEVKEEIRLKKLPIKTSWELPPISLLDKTESRPDSGDIKENIEIIKTTFENFGINVEVVEVTIGPTVTRYAIKPPEGVKLSKILALQNDLALALAVQNIRMEAPIPGRALIGIEVPNIKPAIVRLRSLIENPEFLESESLLLFPVGRLITGEPFYADLALMPHILIAGTTGSGKSVFIHSILISLLMKNTPEVLNFILVDPKRIELIRYENLPHLLMDPILDVKKVVPVMNWVIDEMERRYKEFQNYRVRDIDAYNKLQIQKKKKIMPRIIFVIDEMADLMIKQGNMIESAIVRLAQMARATGIHLVLATQRPSVNVVTGLIKANIPNRICFKVASQVDSRTVLDYSGAEKLIGAGDMLFISNIFGGMKRIQAPLVTEKEIERIVDFWAKQALEKEDFEKEEISLEEYEKPKEAIETEETEEELVKAAFQIILETGKASTSLLQRKLKIGYSRAARILDILEEKGIVGPQEGTKPRKILIENIEEFKERINGKEVE
ncbi:MAG: DNA translocase FtsK 4TM domain-containing protein [Minisyncoccia bacterium]|jgi:S-DNA-T family DNA segregation ATPase FtsK/SpoIIIE